MSASFCFTKAAKLPRASSPCFNMSQLSAEFTKTYPLL